MPHYTELHLTVSWPPGADLEDALARWDLTKQDLYNIWPDSRYDQILDDLMHMDPEAHTTNVFRDAGLFSNFLEHGV